MKALITYRNNSSSDRAQYLSYAGANDYYSYGMQKPGADGALGQAQPYKYGGKERLAAAGLNLYDFGPRALYSPAAQFTSMDPKCEDYPHLSPYLYCAANPVNAIDPTGMSTWVIPTDDGRYKIVGGDLDDDDLNIYVVNIVNGEFVKGKSIGVTTCITTFYNSDGQSGWATDGYIDPNDNSGKDFLHSIETNTPNLYYYMYYARHYKKYDFKTTSGTSTADISADVYRGMPIGTNSNGQTVYSSARDIGNMTAGNMAAKNGMPYWASRIAFDLYQGGKEGATTQNAELYGWQLGNANTNALEKTMNFITVTNVIFRYDTFSPTIGAGLAVYNLYLLFKR